MMRPTLAFISSLKRFRHASPSDQRLFAARNGFRNVFGQSFSETFNGFSHLGPYPLIGSKWRSRNKTRIAIFLPTFVVSCLRDRDKILVIVGDLKSCEVVPLVFSINRFVNYRLHTLPEENLFEPTATQIDRI